ncbi:MAG: toprim domain-containing protein, partial [Clostridiales bacterium]|nr:toprim domain-containing protein [Clostridiales bacterium]
TCWVYGRPAVCLLGLGTQKQYEQLRKLKCRKLITALDPDEAGQRATARLKKAMKGNKLVTSFTLPVGKDINDLEKQEFDNLEELF